MKLTKLLTAAGLSVVAALSGCNGVKHVTENTAENYYFYEQTMENAKVTTRKAIVYAAGLDSVYATVDDLKEGMKDSADTTIVACNYKDHTCETYTLNKDSDTKVGLTTYTYRFDSSNYIISKSGNGVYTDFKFENGRISSITQYEGEEKVAGAAVLSERTFVYDENNVNTQIIVKDNENDKTITYNVEYNEQGKPVKLSGMDENGINISNIQIEYNEKGLMSSRTTVAINNGTETVSSYAQYTYE